MSSINNKLLAIVIDYLVDDLNKALDILKKVVTEGIQCYNDCIDLKTDYELKWDVRDDIDEARSIIRDVISKLKAIIG